MKVRTLNPIIRNRKSAQIMDVPLSGDLPRAIDHQALIFERLSQETGWKRLMIERRAEITQVLFRMDVQPDGIYWGEEAASQVSTFIAGLESFLIHSPKGYGPMRWLWYLRRIPRAFLEGDRETTFAYDATLAESLTWYSPHEDIIDQNKNLKFRVDESVFRHLCNFIAGVKVLSDLHSFYRRIGKGAGLRISKKVIDLVESQRTIQAIETYDARNDKRNEMVMSGFGLGTAPTDVRVVEEARNDSLGTLFIFVRCEPSWIPVNGPDGAGGYIDLQVLAQHALMKSSILDFVCPFGPGISLPNDYHAKQLPLLLLCWLLLPIYYRVPYALSSALQHGYFVLRASIFQKLLTEYWASAIEILTKETELTDWPKNSQELVANISETSPSLWPLEAAGVFRSVGDLVTIDVAAMSQALLHGAELDRRLSLLANDRANAFELQVQRLIDDSLWQPVANLAKLRGQTLRRNNVPITDIDAIGSNGTTLLLVSCKSLIYDREYDRGTFRVVRNAQSTIDEATKYWTTTVKNLLDLPGDNFDFSKSSNAIAIVCAPFPVYSDDEQTMSFVVDDLRNCASYSELKRWLRRNQSGQG